jgi:hypothetical protein
VVEKVDAIEVQEEPIVLLTEVRGWDWVTQADSNCVIHYKKQKMNVNTIAKCLPEKCFKKIKIKGEDFVVGSLKVWMPKIGDVRLIISEEGDGLHFFVSSRLDYSARQVLLAYKQRHRIEEFYRDA